MLAFASLMMAACANNDLVDDLVKEEVPQAIGFETFAQKATRATENNDKDYNKQAFDNLYNEIFKEIETAYNKF